MDGRFWIFCRLRGNTSVRGYAWARVDMDRVEREAKDEKFLRSREGKKIRRAYWQTPREGLLGEEDEEDDPKNEVELLERCRQRTELEICGAPDSKLLKRMLNNYTERLQAAQAKLKQDQTKIKQRLASEARNASLLKLSRELFANAQGSEDLKAKTKMSANKGEA